MSLRLLALYIIVPIVVVGIFRNPFIGIPFIAIYHSWRPDMWGAPSFFRPEFIITASLLLGIFIKTDNVNIKKINGLFIVFFLLSMWLLINSKNAVVSEDIAFEYSVRYFKVILVLFIFSCLINNIQRVYIFFWALIGGLLWLSKSIFWQYFVEGRSRVDPLGGGGGGGNAIATELCMTLPFLLMIYFEREGREKWLAALLIGVWIIDFIAIASRGAFIAALIVLILFFIKTQYKKKFLIYIFWGLMLSSFVVPKFFLERMNSIVEYEEDASAMSRIDLWSAGIDMFVTHPILGVGTQNFKLLAKKYSDSNLIPEGGLVAHNSYVEIMAENGLPGIILYLSGLCYAFIFLRRLRFKFKAEDSEKGIWLTHSIEIGLVAFILRGMTGSNYSNEVLIYFIGVISGMYNHHSLTIIPPKNYIC